MNVVVWNENIHEQRDPRVTELYPGGLHSYIASFLTDEDMSVTTATLDMPESFSLPSEEMYGEPFGIPEPQEVVFMGWFDGGEVFRSGCTFVRNNGRIFYFQPGHETNPSYQNQYVQQIIRNGVRWCCPINRKIGFGCPNTAPVEPC